jgi:hypothetical protein
LKLSSALKPKTEEEEDPSTHTSKLTTEEDHSSNTDLDSCDKSDSTSFSDDTTDEKLLLSTWKNIFMKAFDQVDEELRQHSGIDCICSGTTAVTVVRQVLMLLLLQACKLQLIVLVIINPENIYILLCFLFFSVNLYYFWCTVKLGLRKSMS